MQTPTYCTKTRRCKWSTEWPKNLNASFYTFVGFGIYDDFMLLVYLVRETMRWVINVVVDEGDRRCDFCRFFSRASSFVRAGKNGRRFLSSTLWHRVLSWAIFESFESKIFFAILRYSRRRICSLQKLSFLSKIHVFLFVLALVGTRTIGWITFSSRFHTASLFVSVSTTITIPSWHNFYPRLPKSKTHIINKNGISFSRSSP